MVCVGRYSTVACVGDCVYLNYLDSGNPFWTVVYYKPYIFKAQLCCMIGIILMCSLFASKYTLVYCIKVVTVIQMSEASKCIFLFGIQTSTEFGIRAAFLHQGIWMIHVA
jgi:hypothetical protein